MAAAWCTSTCGAGVLTHVETQSTELVSFRRSLGPFDSHCHCGAVKILYPKSSELVLAGAV